MAVARRVALHRQQDPGAFAVAGVAVGRCSMGVRPVGDHHIPEVVLHHTLDEQEESVREKKYSALQRKTSKRIATEPTCKAAH